MAFDRRWFLDGFGSLSADAAAGATPASDSLAAW